MTTKPEVYSLAKDKPQHAPANIIRTLDGIDVVCSFLSNFVNSEAAFFDSAKRETAHMAMEISPTT
jgi:hypothetical protein